MQEESINGQMLSGLENPELDMKANVNNIIQIQNPTNTKHELVIDSQGKEVATSGDITPGPRGLVQAQWDGLIQLSIVNTILIQ